MNLIENEEYWEVQLKDRTVTRCMVDGSFAIETWVPRDTVRVRIEAPFRYSTITSKHELDPDKPKTLGPALSILGKNLIRVLAEKKGHLNLLFSDQSTVDVEPHAEYEAWEISSATGMLLVCKSGGEIAFWSEVDN